jgi:insecticidal toxin complex protein TccC
VTADNRFDVLNESETKAMDTGSVLIARGLEKFPEAARQKVDAAFAEGELWLRHALAELSSSTLSRGTKLILGEIFGRDAVAQKDDLETLRTALIANLSDLRNYLRDLKENNGWRLGLVAFRENYDGLTTSSKSQGHNIWLNVKAIDEVHTLSLANILVHESAHAMYADKSRHIYDFWYLSVHLPAAATPGEVEDYPPSKLILSGDVVDEGPVEKQMNPHGRKAYEEIINASLTQTGQSPTTSPSERRAAFVNNPRVRVAVIMRNADSYPGLLMNFRRKN